MIRIIINKAVTNEGSIMLTNLEEYGLELKVGLLASNSINDKDNPFCRNFNIRWGCKGSVSSHFWGCEWHASCL